MPKSKKNITLELMSTIQNLKTPKQKKRSKQKNKINTKNSKKKVKVGKVDNLVVLARIGDKTRSKRTNNELGIIIEYDKNKDIWITNTGRKLYNKKQNKSWEIVYYRIYVLSLRPKPYKRRKYLPEGWPFNSPAKKNSNNEEFSSSGTNENNVDLMDRNSNELESTNNNDSFNNEEDMDYRKLYMCVVSAANPESARQFIIDNDLYGTEDCDENGDAYKNSIWLDEYLSSCKDVGEAFHQENMLLCINKY